jgi:hypothetical protein
MSPVADNDDEFIAEHSPLGHMVVCSKRQYESIISADGHGHGDMKGRESEVAETLRDPGYIYSSKTPSGRHLYFSRPRILLPGKPIYTKVVTAKIADDSGRWTVVTAHMTQRLGANKEDMIYDAVSKTVL